MISSMTGYGRADAVENEISVNIEIKSVNHRYCEISVRMPQSLLRLEDEIKNRIKGSIARGKIDVFLTLSDNGEKSKTPSLNEPLLNEYIRIFSMAFERFGIENDLTATSVARLPDVLTYEKPEPDIPALREIIMPVLERAINDFIAQRRTEGEFLVRDIDGKCDEIVRITDKIKSRAETLVPAYVEQLKTRTSQLMGDVNIDKQRLYTEIAIMADRMAIDEELVRLASHTASMKKVLGDALSSTEPEAIGKKIDFRIQEMNREINTVTSKIGDMEVTEGAIEIKTLIEKIREQLQNIE